MRHTKGQSLSSLLRQMNNTKNRKMCVPVVVVVLVGFFADIEKHFSYFDSLVSSFFLFFFSPLLLCLSASASVAAYPVASPSFGGRFRYAMVIFFYRKSFICLQLRMDISPGLPLVKACSPGDEVLERFHILAPDNVHEVLEVDGGHRIVRE